MFKKECRRCGKKVNNSYEFCPYCGSSLKNYREEDFGLLGKSDIQSFEEIEELPMGFNAMFNFLMKNLGKDLNKHLNEVEREFDENRFKNIDRQPRVKKRGISINISTLGNGQPRIRVKSFGDDEIFAQKKFKKSPALKSFSEEKAREFLSLHREEPKTNIRRLSNKVVYEIEMPGVKKIEDISIVKLESSIEIKAISKNKAYSKLIPVNLPIINYNFEKEKLILEFGVRE